VHGGENINMDHIEIGCVGETTLTYLFLYILLQGHAMPQLVEALRYKPEGRGFDS